MPPPASKYAKKRKAGMDDDTSAEGIRAREKKEAKRREREAAGSSDEDRPPSPDRKKSRKRRDSGDGGDGGGGNEAAESMSIEETNKLRVSLGLAPLEVDDAPKVRDAEDGETGDKLVNEDGFEFRHRVAVDLTKKKAEEKLKEKLATAKAKREVYNRVLKGAKGLAEDSDDDDGGASSWVERQRRLEEDKKKVADRNKELDDMDEEAIARANVEDQKRKAARAKAKQRAKQQAQNEASAGGLVVGHSKEAFLEGRDQILVLDDKSVLDEDAEEVLINPNLVDNERYKQNIQNRKKGDRYKPYAEGLDEFGNPMQQNMLAKYDDELGIKPNRDTFRLGDDGMVDIDQEARELEMKRKLMMTSKQLVSLETNKYQVASEYFTQEEMLSFRRPKKSKEGKKIRKRGNVLKADDLKPQEDEGKARKERSRRRLEEIAADEDEGGWKKDGEDKEKDEEDGEKKVKKELKEEPMESDDDKEEGEIDDESSRGPWKKAGGGTVDLNLLKKTVAQTHEEEDSDEDEYSPMDDLAGVVIDDDAESELHQVLERARKLKNKEAAEKAKTQEDVAVRVRDMLTKHGGPVKMEVDDDEEEVRLSSLLFMRQVAPEEDDDPNAVVIDATKEYCRNIGGIQTYGLAGNRHDAVDVAELNLEVKEEVRDDEEEEFASVAKWKKIQAEKERRRQAKMAKKQKERRGGWQEAGTVDSDDEKAMEEVKQEVGDASTDEEEEDEVYQNVLGAEKDVTKGIGAMLRLAGEKGYLENTGGRGPNGPSLKHLENQRFSKIEQGRHDIEDKYQRKLERLGTTGSGPLRSFPEKKDYKPEIDIHYVDNKGRDMEPKDAFRTLSWKFHGKNPGKKQIEKRSSKMDQKEKLKQMNSSDTPLGTLDKLRKKQEQLQTPFLVLSGSGTTNVKKE